MLPRLGRLRLRAHGLRLDRLRGPRLRLDGLRGPWRVAVAEGSMAPAVHPGDWLLVDPTVARWPRRGTAVVVREPDGGDLAIKRVAARPGDWVPFADGWLQLGPGEAWLLGDATDEEARDAGFGAPVDSRRYGPVTLDALVARAWLRYWPATRIGRIAPPPADLLERGRAAPAPGSITPEVPVPGRPSGGGHEPG